VINRAQEILSLLETESREMRTRKGIMIQQLSFFPETNPLLEDLENLEIDALSPLEALNKLYEWQQLLRKSQEESET
jgi:DNA mismatch repair protein MutS